MLLGPEIIVYGVIVFGFLALLLRFVKGGFTAARKAFVTKEVWLIGSVYLRGKWAMAAGVLFVIFTVCLSLLFFAIVWGWRN